MWQDKSLLYPGIADSHFHSLSMGERELDARAVLSWCFDHGLSAALDVGLSPEDLPERQALLAGFGGIAYSSGVSPFHAGRPEIPGLLERLRRQVLAGGISAVGEIGLDWYRMYGDRDSQLELFREQLVIARSAALPVIIHNRDADSDVLEAVRSVGNERGGILHCFSSGTEAAKAFVDAGYLLSFAGNVTYKSAGELREAARWVPAERLLVETDAPFLAPLPVRGKANHPGYLGHTVRFLAELRAEDPKELAARTAANLQTLISPR